MDNIQIIDTFVAEGRLREAIGRLGEMIAEAPEDNVYLAGLYFRRGKLSWRSGDRAGATSDYAKAAALDPTSPAVKALEHARDVADFFNPDLYNP